MPPWDTTEKLLSKDEKTFGSFAFHILHINRLRATESLVELIEKRVLKILGDYFTENALAREYQLIVKEEPHRKEQINKLEDFILTERHRFARRLIVLIDDIDETAEADVEESLRCVYALIECHQICKWLIIRNTTLSNYKAEFLGFIETKFGQAIKFPSVDLHGIIATRIHAVNPEGTNPFTRDICARLLQTFNFDLRQAVAAVPSFLEQVEPLDSGSYSASFVGHYFNKNSTRVMTASQVFPNIYSKSQLRYIPLEKDVFLIIALYNEFPRGYLPKLLDLYRDIFTNHRGGRYANEAYLVNFDMRHVLRAVEYLKNQRLIITQGDGSDDCRLTDRGIAFAQFVSERLYTNYCEAECEGVSDNKHPMFWVLAKRLLNV